MDICPTNPPEKAHRTKQRLCPEANRSGQTGKDNNLAANISKAFAPGSKEERPNTSSALVNGALL